MPVSELRETGETVSAIGLGGLHIFNSTIKQEEATRLIRRAVDRGITFMGNSWDYKEGARREMRPPGFAQLVLPKLTEQGIGVLGMKPFCCGDGIILKSNAVQPLDCLHYALNLPTSVVITGIDKPEVLDQAFQAAKSFQMMNHEHLAALVAKTQEAAANGKFELFKTTSHFDTTARHPDWLGTDKPEVQKLAPELAG